LTLRKEDKMEGRRGRGMGRKGGGEGEMEGRKEGRRAAL
jgi:hypothetical protein